MSDRYRNLRVDPLGNADFSSLSEAAFFLKGSKISTKLVLAPTAYNESVVFECSNLIVTGETDDPADTVIVDSHYAKELHPQGFTRGTFWTAVVRTDGNNITFRNLTITNAAGNGKKVGQAIALYADGCGILVENCRLIGHQDTLFTAPFPDLNKHGRNEGFGPKNDMPRDPSVQIYRRCFIEGDVDFIFGGATALFEECTIYSHDAVAELDPDDKTSCRGYICAPCTVPSLKYGYLFIGCRMVSNCPDHTVYLGRPWRPYGRAVFINCITDEHICEDLFNDWDNIANRETSYFAVSEDMAPEEKIPGSFYHVMKNDAAREYISSFKSFVSNFFNNSTNIF